MRRIFPMLERFIVKGTRISIEILRQCFQNSSILINILKINSGKRLIEWKLV